MADQDQDLVDVYDDRAGGFPEYDWNSAPKNLLFTRRQLRAAGLSPGGHGPVAHLRCRRCSYRPLTECTHLAWLYDVGLAKPKRTATLAQEWALDRAMAARQTCPYRCAAAAATPPACRSKHLAAAWSVTTSRRIHPPTTRPRHRSSTGSPPAAPSEGELL